MGQKGCVSGAGGLTGTPGTESQEQVRNFVARCYNTMLKRDYDEAGLEDWTSRLLNHEITGAQMVRGFVLSQEVENQDLSNDELIERMYETMFDRASDAAGKADWMNRMANGLSRSDLVGGFSGSQEFHNLCAEFGITPGE